MPRQDRIVVASDRALPYSRGFLAQSLTACGIAPDQAYRVARVVDAALRRSDQPHVTTDELRERVEAVLAEEGGDALERYRRWSALRRLDRPVIVVIGGAPGTGKSTIATQLAHRLAITRIVSTDVVRQVMRATIARELVPQLHASSFEVAGTLPASARARAAAAGRDPMLVGFARQSEAVLVGVRGIVERATSERFPLVLEGVHLVPGSRLAEADARAVIVRMLLVVRDPMEHQAHFHLRAEHTGDARPVERYLDAFDEIRRIQAFLEAEAIEAGEPIVEASDLDHAVRCVLDIVLERVADERSDRPATLPECPGTVAASVPTSSP